MVFFKENVCNLAWIFFKNYFKAQPVLTTQGDPPVATALHIAAPPVAMSHFVVARGGTPVGKNFMLFTKHCKIAMRNCINFVDTPSFSSALSAFVIRLFCLSYICSAALPTSRLAYTRCQNSLQELIAAELLECRKKFLKF